MLRKSLLFIALTAFVGYVSAQTLQFEYQGAALANNEKIIFEEAPSAIGEMVLEMNIHNLSDQAVEVTVEKELIKVVEGTENSFCWGQCFGPDVFTSRPPVPMEPNSVSADGALSFHYQVDPTYSGDPDACLPGTTIIKYYAYTTSDPDNKVCVEVWFAYNATEIAENSIDFGHAYPNPASTQVSFDLRGNGIVNAVVYNLLGQEVKSMVVNASQSKVNFDLSDMQPGIYFCSFIVNDEVLKTEKFIVKK